MFKAIKWLVPFFIVLILYKRFYKNPTLSFDVFFYQFRSLPWYWYLSLFLFACTNWFLEIKKWQFLVKRLEQHSFRTAVKSVLSGVAVSALLPYRTGEYFGRLAFISDKNKIKAGIFSVAGSFSQLLITLFFGIIAFIYVHPLDYPVSFTLSFIALLLLLLFGYFYMPQFNGLKRLELVSTIRASLRMLNKIDLLKLLGFSGLRYFTFVLPYAMLAMYFEVGLQHSMLYLLLAVSCIYFLQTVSPNFILTDLTIRISVSALVFSGSIDSINGFDHLPAMIIYVFNVALPMCAGALVLLLMRLRR